MLGSMVVDVLSREADLAVAGTVRSTALARHFAGIYPGVRWAEFLPGGNMLDEQTDLFDGQSWIINAIGITKPLIHDDNPNEIETAIKINALLPHCVGQTAATCKAKVLQIATDCVYSGAKGEYVESDLHDTIDVYGKTKSLGETYIPSVHHLRCSIIGPEPKDFKFLIEWFRRQPERGEVNGFTNHRWNGVTTLHFARLCLGVIRNRIELNHLQHVIPSGHVSKAAMLREFAAAFNRPDIVIRDVEAKAVIDRTLATRNGAVNAALWKAAGYSVPPTVSEMITELAQYQYRAAGRVAATV